MIDRFFCFARVTACSFYSLLFVAMQHAKSSTVDHLYKQSARQRVATFLSQVNNTLLLLLLLVVVVVLVLVLVVVVVVVVCVCVCVCVCTDFITSNIIIPIHKYMCIHIDR